MVFDLFLLRDSENELYIGLKFLGTVTPNRAMPFYYLEQPELMFLKLYDKWIAYANEAKIP